MVPLVALVRVFEMLGDNVTDGRATIEMSGNLRAAAQLLRELLEAGFVVEVAAQRRSTRIGSRSSPNEIWARRRTKKASVASGCRPK